MTLVGGGYKIGFMKKLSQIVKHFNHNHLSDAAIRQLADYAYLRAELPTMFDGHTIPGAVNTFVQHDGLGDKAFTKTLGAEQLAVHTRDDAWLAHYLRHLVKLHAEYPFQPSPVKMANVKTFVTDDPEFDLERNHYEQAVAAEVIQQTAIDQTTTAADFRAAVMNTSARLGLDQHNAAAAIADVQMM